MSLCPYAYLRVSLSGLLTASDQGSLTTFGELLNISTLDPLLPTLLIATLCLCALLTILYYSLVVAWEVFWASRRSPSPLDPSAEVVLTLSSFYLSLRFPFTVRKLEHQPYFSLIFLPMNTPFSLSFATSPSVHSLIDHALPSSLCSLWPVPQRRPTHRPQTHTDLFNSLPLRT